MSIHVAIPTVVPTHPVVAELSAHLDAATARLLALIREFDARGGWNRRFRSCAEWLPWRGGLEPGAARGAVPLPRAPGTLPHVSEDPGRGQDSYFPGRNAANSARAGVGSAAPAP